jgi:hypothetical protein
MRLYAWLNSRGRGMGVFSLMLLGSVGMFSLALFVHANT